MEKQTMEETPAAPAALSSTQEEEEKETQEEKENKSMESQPPPPPLLSNQNSQDSSNDLRKTSTPDRLNVPKAFKYPERYRSPTDSMMSPVSKGLLCRNRKGGAAALLLPSLNHSKFHMQELKGALFQN